MRTNVASMSHLVHLLVLFRISFYINSYYNVWVKLSLNSLIKIPNVLLEIASTTSIVTLREVMGRNGIEK